MPKPKTVDDYIKGLPAAVRRTLSQIRKTIKSAAPQAEEYIGYGIPYYKYNGAFMAYMMHKNHCSLVTMSYDIIKDLKSELKPYKVSGTTIQFPHDKPLPAALVKKIVKARVREKDRKKKISKDK